jgi:ribonucleotide reductase alpha subunit
MELNKKETTRLQTLETFGGDEMATDVFLKKYSLNKMETPQDVWKRMSSEFARIENKYKEPLNDVKNLSTYGKKRIQTTEWEKYIYALLEGFNYIIPGGSGIEGIGVDKNGSMANCFKNTDPDDNINSILEVAKEVANIAKRRGGTSVDVSHLRPCGSEIHNASKQSTGVVSWMKIYNATSSEIGNSGRQSGTMITLRVEHPDIIDFIKSKRDHTKLTHTNISIKYTNDFLQTLAVKGDYITRFPIDLNIEGIDYEKLKYGELIPYNNGYVKKLKSTDIWNEFLSSNKTCGDPGCLFWDYVVDRDGSSVYPELEPKGVNLCFSKDSVVMVATKKYVTDSFGEKQLTEIKSIKENDFVWLDKDQAFVPCTGYRSTGVQDVYKVTFSNGSDLEITKEHKLLKNEGFYGIFTELQNLREGDNVYMENDEKTTITGIECIGKKETGCITVPDYGYFTANGIISGNCSELPLSELQSCILIAVNLCSLARNPFATNSFLNEELAYKLFYEAVCLGDDFIDLEEERLIKILKKIEPEIDPDTTVKDYRIFCVTNDLEIDSEYITWLKVKQKLLMGRKIGSGFLGLGDLYAAMSLPYGDPDLTEKLMKIKLKAELDATTDLAIIRGKFHLFDIEKEYNITILGTSGKNEWYQFLSTNFPEEVGRMIFAGRRNVTWSCIAPTGSLGILAQCTSGIEPLFAPYYKRRIKVFNANEPYDVIDVDGQKFKESYVVHEGLKRWYNSQIHEGHYTSPKWEEIFPNSPYYKQTANDLDIHTRTMTQAIVNKYLCSSISSTVNLPSTATTEDIAEVYRSAYENKTKSITCYVDGSKGGVLITDDKKDECGGFEFHSVPKLPKSFRSDFHKVVYKGETYIILTGIHCDFLVELFVFKPSFDNIEEMVPFNKIPSHTGVRKKIKAGLYTFESEFIKIPDLSAYNNIEEKQFAVNISLMLRHGIPLSYICNTIKKFDGHISSFASVVARILTKYDKNPIENKSNVCPECGSASLVRENGCTKCSNCGYSACG